MTRRALVIGCELPSLRGPINDVRSMTGMLQTRGFVVDTRWQATRNDILNGDDALIEASQPGDTAVVYYSGHGYYALLPGDPRPVQCIAPVDIKSDTEWRGITSWELSIKQKQLTRRTQNVTVILDCCHASHMSREAAAAGAVARALPHPVTVGIDAYLAAMREQYGEDFDHVDRDGNPDAVRFVATGKSDPAWEDIGSDGLPHGYFTSILLDVLHE
ncbi:MAG TPA: caspase family protein, partial [Kofleriaceae bacterium]|nr:caspase family protein [Kofleriaceae bacterium]